MGGAMNTHSSAADETPATNINSNSALPFAAAGNENSAAEAAEKNVGASERDANDDVLLTPEQVRAIERELGVEDRRRRRPPAAVASAAAAEGDTAGGDAAANAAPVAPKQADVPAVSVGATATGAPDAATAAGAFSGATVKETLTVASAPAAGADDVPRRAASRRVRARRPRERAADRRTRLRLYRPQPAPLEPVLLSPDEAAVALSTTRERVYHLIKTGALPYVALGSRKILRVPYALLKEHIAFCARAPLRRGSQTPVLAAPEHPLDLRAKTLAAFEEAEKSLVAAITGAAVATAAGTASHEPGNAPADTASESTAHAGAVITANADAPAPAAA